MYQYLDFFLVEITRAAWEKFKEKFPSIMAKDLALRVNLHNFINRIQLIITAQSENRGSLDQQQEAIRRLEQLNISNWDNIKNFLQEYAYYTMLAGCFYDEGITKKLILKLPGQLGKTIHEKYKKIEWLDSMNKNITVIIRYIMNELEEK